MMAKKKPRSMNAIPERSERLPGSVNFCPRFMPVEVNLSPSPAFHTHEEGEIYGRARGSGRRGRGAAGGRGQLWG